MIMTIGLRNILIGTLAVALSGVSAGQSVAGPLPMSNAVAASSGLPIVHVRNGRKGAAIAAGIAIGVIGAAAAAAASSARNAEYEGGYAAAPAYDVGPDDDLGYDSGAGFVTDERYVILGAPGYGYAPAPVQYYGRDDDYRWYGNRGYGNRGYYNRNYYDPRYNNRGFYGFPSKEAAKQYWKNERRRQVYQGQVYRGQGYRGQGYQGQGYQGQVYPGPVYQGRPNYVNPQSRGNEYIIDHQAPGGREVR